MCPPCTCGRYGHRTLGGSHHSRVERWRQPWPSLPWSLGRECMQDACRPVCHQHCSDRRARCVGCSTTLCRRRRLSSFNVHSASLPGTPVFAWPALAAAAATKACGASAVGGAGGTLWRDEAIPGPATQARCRLLCGTAAAAEIARRARHTQRLRAGRCIELHGWEVAVARQANQGHAGRI